MKWKCKDVTENRLAYLDGALPSAEREELELHLESCAACGKALEEMQRTWALLDLYDEVEPSSSFVGDTLSAVQRDRARARRQRIRRTLTALAASLVIVTGVVLFKTRSLTPPRLEEPAQQAVMESELLESLDLIEDLDFLLEYGEDLELAMECDLYDILSDGESL